MKFFRKLLPLIALSLTMFSCMGIGDDTSNCVWDENTKLFFKYADGGGGDDFSQNINSVDAFIFDKDQKFVTRKRFERADLDDFRGWSLTLPQGDYYAVCWANAEENSLFNDFTIGVTTLDQCLIQIAPGATATSDSIFYSPAKTHPHSRAFSASSGSMGTRANAADLTNHAFTIMPGKTLTKEMMFTAAHLTVNVLITGVSDPTEVTGTQLWSEYDFLFNTKGAQRDFAQICTSTIYDNKPALIASFHSFFGEITDNINFIVKRVLDSNILETVNLKQFIADNPTARDGNTINILIAFSDLGVTVTVPNWGEKPVTPGN